ncbi:MAG: DUF805 domain-containing protein [Cryobacterium sp.]
MTFFDSITTARYKFAQFTGRASLPEFWWFILFAALSVAALGALNIRTPTGTIYIGSALAGAWWIVLLLPTLAVAVRRLRDTGRGWPELFWLLLPVAGVIVLAVYLSKPSVATAPATQPGAVQPG